jgi:hypothetical protein
MNQPYQVASLALVDLNGLQEHLRIVSGDHARRSGWTGAAHVRAANAQTVADLAVIASVDVISTGVAGHTFRPSLDLGCERTPTPAHDSQNKQTSGATS